jgi:putative ABC transport system ATP-binding protein
MDSLIKLENIQKSYFIENTAIPVLHDVNLSISQGEFVAIMGHSGSGKSTLMNILGCLDLATGGNYYLNGENVSLLSPNQIANLRNRLIGFVFQGFNLLKRMTALENVALPMLYAGISKAEQKKRALEVLKQMGLEKHVNSLPNQMSGGQQQRIAIARSLANNPPLILADEPTGNLDTKTSDDIMALFTELNKNQGITIILVTHEPDIARYAQRMIRFMDGRITYDGTALNC